MPARSVSTLKLIARSALTTAKRAAFARSQPTITMTSAIASRQEGDDAAQGAQARAAIQSSM